MNRISASANGMRASLPNWTVCLLLLNTGVIIATVALLLTGASTPSPTASDQLTVRTISIVDDNGKVRMKLDTVQGLPRLIMYDSNDVARYYTGLDRRPFEADTYDHLETLHYSTEGDMAISIGMGHFSISGESGKTTVTSGGLSVVSGDDSKSIYISSGLVGGPDIMLVGSEARVSLLESRGKLMAVLGATKLESIRTGSTESLTPGSLVLFDRNGKVLTRLP